MGRERKAWLHGGDGHRKGHKGYWVCWSEYKNGQRKRRIKKRNSLKEAEVLVSELTREMQAKADAKDGLVTIDNARFRFLKACHQVATNTKRHYTSTTKQFANHVGSARLVRCIDGEDIDDFLGAMAEKRAPATVRKHYLGLHRFFAWCVMRRIIGDNPCKWVTAKPKSKHVADKRMLSDAEIERLIEAIDTEDRRAAVLIAISTGLDRQMITDIEAKHIDIWDRTFKVRRRKTGKQLVIPIRDALFKFLEQRIAECPKGPLLRGLNKQARPNDWFKKALRRAKLPEDFKFSTLRTVASTRFLRNKIPVQEVQKHLGHSTMETTLGHYHIADPEVIGRLRQIPLPGEDLLGDGGASDATT